VDRASGRCRIFASGLRNPNGLSWEPQTGALWAVVNERDELGPNLVPDYLTSVQDGGFYGWPYSYFGKHVDQRVQPQRPDLVEKTIVPDYALGSHVAPLGLGFNTGSALPESYQGAALVSEHGSWNRPQFNG
jgi:glucose/arabinose dehydrogenase